MLFAVLFSLGLEVANHQFLERRKASFVAHLITSLGIYIFIVQVIAVVFGNSPKQIRTFDDFCGAVSPTSSSPASRSAWWWCAASP